MTADFTPAQSHLRQSEERFRLLVDSVRDYAIFMLDPSGHVLTWNAGAERFKGYQAEEIIGQHFSRFYPSAALARGLPEQELEIAARDGSFEDEGWRVRKDGSLFWANVVITAMRDPDGELVGFAKVTRDLTQRRSHEEALRQSEERFRLLVEGVAEYAIFMLDVNGRIATWNVGAQRIKGYRPDEIIGRHFSVFYPQDVRDSGWPEHELQVAAETGRFIDTGWRVRKDGTMFWANVTITALRDESGKLIGFAKLTRDLTDSKRAQAIEIASLEREALLEAERSARIEAQRATRIKDEFLATLSHELRTPLSAILGWTQILARGQALSADQRRGIDVIARNARAQVRLIDEMLDMNRILTGKIRLEMQQISMREVVQCAIDAVAPEAMAKGISLQNEFGTTAMPVSGDSSRLQQVVWNLLTNAIKFTPAGGQIRVLLNRVEPHVELSVADTGVGIPDSFISQVFERFWQRDSSTSRAHGGLGLGLAICKHLVELHGGTIRVESPGEGQGATFFVDLPVSVEAVVEPGEGGPGAGASDAQGPLPPRLHGVHAAIVDDEPDAREILELVLTEQGATVVSFGAAEEALAVIATSRPAVIVSDIGMPGMDGYQMIRALRAGESAGDRIPALALTAFARADDRDRALAAGFQAHLAKPFDTAELVRLIAELVGR
ncbi:PAS domain S-box protein [Piscinibacter sakaiensis]|uniref:PAS domain S-box protein n=1 Tax=Piscinibacter sakaiensis TaxID=1547922 RepID=UPI003AABF3DB